jgi:hypothetical protein
MALDLGTRIGVDGKRYPIGGDVPDSSDAENRAVLPIFGVPGSGQVPVWNVLRGRLEWGEGGGGAGGASYEEFQMVLDGLTAAVAEVNDLPPRVDDLEASRVSSTTLTGIERVTQVEYDSLTPNETTLYVIVAGGA